MGNTLGSLRSYLPQRRTNHANNNNVGDLSSSPSSAANTNNNNIHAASSRLNLINQLILLGGNGGGGGGGIMGNKRGGKTTNALTDFHNVSFASHFFMAGRKFKNIITQAQTFLFGDQLDLGFLLAHKPLLVI